MGHIFISYSRHDVELVNVIVTRLEQAGLSIWIDRQQIKAGKTWRAQIVQAIDTCDAFVLMLSSRATVSENVRKEIDLAQDSGRAVFIARLDSVTRLPSEMRYQLVGLQYIDVPALGLEQAVGQLIDTLKEQLGASKPEGQEPVRQVELVIQGVDPSLFGAQQQEQLLDVISEITQTPESQLQIAKLAGGSVHVFMDMPAPAAFALKARALNRDQRLKRSGIQSLRIVGDRKYINISLGILTTSAALGALHVLWLSLSSVFPSILGMTAGTILVFASAIAVATAIGVGASNTVSLRLTPTPAATRTSLPTLLNPLVLRDTVCRVAPGGEVLSTVNAGTQPELLGRGNVPGWFIIRDPISGDPCWIEAGDLRVAPDYDLMSLPIFTPSPLALPLNKVDIIVTPTLPLPLPGLTPPLCGSILCTPVPLLP